jgi:hypothetical protein
MKKISLLTIAITTLMMAVSCDKGFKELNVNPNNPTSLDAAFLFTNAQYSNYNSLFEFEPTIVQQFVNPFSGVTSAFNFNVLNQSFTSSRWNNTYNGSVKLIVQTISQVRDVPARSNLYNEARIWRAYQFMTLVDTYGDVPYSEAGQAYLNSILNPKYDKQQDIYADIVKELTEASAALDPTKDIVTADLFYAGNVAQWKKLGYSLLLRAGMRYSKADPAKAQAIVQAAFAGGVMQSNTDNCLIRYTQQYPNVVSTGVSVLTNTYYLAEPFVTQLKSTNDPRLKYFSAKYADPGKAPGLVGDTTTANQFGLPVGYDSGTLPTAPGYRGAIGAGFNYSQINYAVIAKVTTPQFFVTYAQTQLLLAEAAFRGWISGSAGAYYNSGIKAAMDQIVAYDATAVIPINTQNAYINSAGVAYDDADALRLINTQYWINSFTNGPEAWANFRRSGFPALAPNRYPGRQIKGDFVHRFNYPLNEATVNPDNYRAAVASIGGSDDLDARIFWDK